MTYSKTGLRTMLTESGRSAVDSFQIKCRR